MTRRGDWIERGPMLAAGSGGGGSGDPPPGSSGPSDGGGSGPSDGDIIIINGREYVWSPSIGWLISTGRINIDTPVYHALDPFWNAEPSEWGKPFPLWGSGGANTPGLSQHVQQQQLIEITAYVDINQEFEIPLLDANNNPILDPAIPPNYLVRRSATGSNSGQDDYVTDVANTGIWWTDQQCNIKPYPSNHVNVTNNELEDPAISVVFRIEKTPVPHWVARITYTFNQLTTGGGTSPVTSWVRTVLIQAMGVGACTNAARDIQVGTYRNVGHYRVRKVFWPDQDPNAAGSVTRFAQPIYTHDQAYVASGSVASTIWLTNDGLSTGTSLFDVSVPYARCFGDREFQQNRGTTETNYKSTSLGVGFDNDGIWAHHGGISIRHNHFDEFMMVTRIGYFTTGRWRVEIYNLIDSTDVAGNRVRAGFVNTAWSRHASLHCYGRGA